MNELIMSLSVDGSNPELHCLLADKYVKEQRWMEAVAEYRSSIALGNKDLHVLIKLAKAYLSMGKVDLVYSTCNGILHQNKGSEASINEQCKELLKNVTQIKACPNEEMDHNTYFRLKTLSNHLNSIFDQSNFSVLDIGGGQGYLSLFLPQSDYVLVEPDINGISGLNLPFDDKSFDCVIACHVLEHIPPEHRIDFLNQLCRKAQKFVIITNPFYTSNNIVVDGQKLIVELTGAQWAKEHLECTLPKIVDLKNFAKENNLGFRVIPNGSKITSTALVFLDHYIGSLGLFEEAKKINKLLNKFESDEIANEKFPNAYIVELTV